MGFENSSLAGLCFEKVVTVTLRSDSSTERWLGIRLKYVELKKKKTQAFEYTPGMKRNG